MTSSFRNNVLCTVLFALCISRYAYGQNNQNLQNSKDWLSIISDTCIYNNNSHSAFTSINEFKGNIFLAFREAEGHHATQTNKGTIKLLKKQGEEWRFQHLFSKNGWDLRDPCLVKWGNKLFVYTSHHYSILENDRWSPLYKISQDAGHELYIWKIREYNNELYGIGHSWGKWPVLLKSNNGKDWTVVTELRIGGNASEADLLFYKNQLYTCFRVDTPDGARSVWGHSVYPFTNFKLKIMDVSIACPDMYLYSKKTILLSGRETIVGTEGNKKVFSLFAIDREGNIKNRIEISSKQGDQGYGSFCRLSDKLFFMSYYFGEEKTKIRLLKFKVLDSKL